MLTVVLLLLPGAFVTCIASAVGKCPVWIPVLLLTVAGLVQHLPLVK
jgi:hypothetical protein